MTDKEFIERERDSIKFSSESVVSERVLLEALDRLEAAHPAEDGLREALEAVHKLLTGQTASSDPGWDACEIIEAALGHAPKVDEERDYTPEEALAEARRRWPDNLIRISAELDSAGQNEKFLKEKGRRIEVVGNGRWNKSIFYGDTFRAAFASADKAPKTGGDK